jgi:pyruvate, orthophosphate dikinase
VLRIPANDLTQLLLPSFDPKRQEEGRSAGHAACPPRRRAAVGKLAFTAAEAVERTHAGEKVMLVRKETSPEDIDGMHSAAAF